MAEVNSGTANIVNPASTPFGSSYPTATCSFQGSDGSYEYLLGNSAGLFRIGLQSTAAGISSIYSNSTQLVKYPFSLNGTFNDSYASTVIVPSDTAALTGSVVTTADGWGTLITPSGTFTNVLRIHAQYNETYAYIHYGPIVQTFDQYSYWKPDVHFPLAEYTTGLQGGLPFSSGSWAVTTVGINEVSADNFKLNVFPNPFLASAEISFVVETRSDVLLEIRDVSGRMVHSFESQNILPGKIILPFDGSSLSNGIYLLSLTINGQTVCGKMVISH